MYYLRGKGVFMICSKCGHEYSDNEKNCPKCGTPSLEPKKSDKKKSSKKKISTPIIIVCIVALCAIVGSIFHFSNSQNKEAQNANSKKVSSEKDNAYDYPSIDKKLLSNKELESMSESDLKLAENEIYARHGKIFDDKKYKNYFEKKSWYKPSIKAKDFDSKMDDLLNDIEKENLKNIKAHLNKDADESKEKDKEKENDKEKNDDEKDTSSSEDKSSSEDSSSEETSSSEDSSSQDSSSSETSSTEGNSSSSSNKSPVDIVLDSEDYNSMISGIREDSGDDVKTVFMDRSESIDGRSGTVVDVYIDHPYRLERIAGYFVDSDNSLYKLDYLGEISESVN